MTVHLSPEVAQKLDSLARRTSRGVDDLLREAAEQFLAYHDWVDRKIQRSLERVDRGELLTHEEVKALIESELAANP